MEDTLQPIKTELFRNLESLVNEIELSFEEINVEPMNKYIRDLKKGNLDFFVKDTYKHLHEYEKQLSLILFSDKKIRTPEYKFVDDIKLFKKGCDHLLNFSVFSAENKNTKKSLLKYTYNIYMSCLFLQSTGSSSELSNFLLNIISHQKDVTQDPPIEEISIPSTLPDMSGIPYTLPDLSGLLGNLQGMTGGGMGGLEDLMSSLMNNSDIMNIANEISNDMKNETLNPMDLMAGMMSGNMTDGPLGNLMSKIQASVDSKINSGEINEAALQEQAHNIINKVQETPGINNIPGFSDLLNKK